MKRFARFAAPVAILLGLVAVASWLSRNPPDAGRRPPQQAPTITVEAETVERSDYQVILDSYGTVQPRTRSVLVSQVGGQIVWVSPSLDEGGYFEAGDVLLRIDPRDYEADLQIAEAQLIDARRALVEAEAQAEQAKKDWEVLRRDYAPSDLVLRKPQLLAAQAQMKSAQSAMAKARLNLERTEIRAPFAGRVLAQRVDLGQVVGPNTALADIYGIEAVEVRLPLRNRDLDFIDLPESYRNADSEPRGEGSVVLRSSLLGESEWIADLVRTEGAIDETSRQLHVVAELRDPLAEARPGEAPIKIGQYVTARLAGRRLQDVIVIPNAAIYQGSYVYLVDEGVLQRTDVDVLWQNDEESIVGEGLEEGDLLVLTPLGQVTSGVRVKVAGEDGPERRAAPDGDGPVIGNRGAAAGGSTGRAAAR